jgi:hypothetical protein
MLAVNVLTPVTPGLGGNTNAGGNALVLDAGLLAATNTVNLTLTATTLAGFGNTVLAQVVINGGTPTTYYNFASQIDFLGLTTDVSDAQKNGITLTSGFGVDLTGDTTGGSALAWAMNADFSLSTLGVADVAVNLSGADTLAVTTGAGPSTITGKIDSPTSAPGLANAEITYTTNGVVTISNAGIYGGVDTYDLAIGPGVGATGSAIVLNGTINVENDVTLADVNSITIAQAITVGNAVAINATPGGVGGNVTVNAPITATNGKIDIQAVAKIDVNAAITATNNAVSLVAATTLAVTDDITAKTGVTLGGNTGIATAAAADILSATGAVTLTSLAGAIAAAGTLTGTAGSVTLNANLNVITTGAITAGTAVKLDAGQGVDIGAAVTVTGAAAGTGTLDVVAAATNVIVRPLSPLTVVDGKIDIESTAGTLTVESLVASNLAIDFTAAQGITLSNAVDATAAVTTTNAGGTITITNTANAILIEAPVAASGDAIEVTCKADAIAVRDDVTGLNGVKFAANTLLTIGGTAAPITVTSTTAALEATSTTGAVTLTPNLVLVLPGKASALSLTAATLVTVPIAVTAGGSVAITSPNGFTVEQPITAVAGGITITTASGAVASTLPTASLVALGDIALDGSTGVTIGQVVKSTAGGVNLKSTGGGVTIGATTALTVPDVVNGTIDVAAGGTFTLGINLVAGSDITVSTGPAFVPTTNFTSATGDVTITVTSGALLDVTGSTITALGAGGGNVSLSSVVGGLKINMATIFAAGDVTLADATGLVSLPGPLTIGGSLVVTTGGGWTPTGSFVSATGSIDVTAAGAIIVTGAALAAPLGSISLKSTTASVAVGAAPNLLAVNPATGSITLDAATAVTVGQPLVAGKDISITAVSPLALTDALAATTGNVTLASTGILGAITTNAPVAAGGVISYTTPGAVLATDTLTSTGAAGGVALKSTAAGVTTNNAVLAVGDITYDSATAVALGAAVSSTAGSVKIGTTITPAGAFALSTPIAGAIGVALKVAGAVTTAVGGTLTSGGGAVAVTSTGAGVTLADAVSGDTGVTVTGAGTVSATVGGTLTSGGGAVAVTSTGAGVTLADAVSGDTGVTVTGAGTVSATVGGTLTSGGGAVAVTSTGAGVTLGDLVVAAGNVNVTALNVVSQAAKITSTGGDISLTSTGLLPTDGVAIGDDLFSAGTIALTAGNVVGNATLGNAIATLLTADALTVTFPAVASISFTNILNDVNSLSIVLPSGVDVSFVDVDDLTATAIATATGAVSLTAGGFLAVTGGIGTATTVTGITLAAVGAVTVTAAGSLEVGLVDPVTGVGNVTVTSTANNVVIDGGVTATKGSIAITSGGGATGVQIGTAGAGGGSLFALNDITLTGASGVAVLGTAAPTVKSTTGDISLTSGGIVTVEAAIQATAGEVVITAVNDINLTGTSIFAGGPSPSKAGAGDVTITSATGNITSSAAISAPANSILIATGGLITFSGGALGAALTYNAGPPPVGLVSIQGGLGVTVTTSPKITCGRLDIDSGSVLAISLTDPGNDVDTLRVITKGNFTYSQTAGPLEIKDPDSATRTVQVQSTGGNVTISATAGLRVVDGIEWGPGASLSLFGGDGAGVDFVSTSTGDNLALPFAGALRDMLGYVNANVATNSAGTGNAAMQVVFDEPSSPLSLGGTITLDATLPAITKRITLDGTLLPAAAGVSVGGIVGIDGSKAGATATGLSLAAGSGGSVLRNAAIHGFAGTGIAVATADNQLSGLLVGLDRGGAADGNGTGIDVSGRGAARNVIGIKTAGDLGNRVAANTLSGIHIRSGATYNLVYGNTIGIDGTGADAGNGRDGVTIESGIGNRVGAAVALFGNTIADSGRHGVFVSDVSGTSIEYGARVVGNVIRDSVQAGVTIRGGGRNLVGGLGVGDGNAISNNEDGVRLVSSLVSPTSDNAIAGNDVSTNRRDGVRIAAGFNNRVNGNTLTNNVSAGVRIFNATTARTQLPNRVINNTASGNGSAALEGGIVIENASGQVVGITATGAAASNVVQGNGGSGIVISGAASTGNTVALNDVTKSAFHGIVVSGGTSNSIVRNTVSGNASAGVAVLDSIPATSAAGNKVTDNSVSGNAVGIRVTGGRFHVIGGTLVADGNRVFSNSGDGILVQNSTISGPATGVTIRNNRVGVNGASPAGNGGFGVRVEGSTSTTIDFANLVRNNVAGGVQIVGGSGTVVGSQVANRGNTISGNSGPGIQVDQPTAGTTPVEVTIAGNVIQANTGDGVLVQGGRTSGVVIGRAPSVTVPNGTGNTITGNGGAGILVNASHRVTMIGNSIGSNAVAPIILQAGANSGVQSPTITSVINRVPNQAKPQWDVRGQVLGTVGQRFYIDLYMDLAAGGQGYMGRVLVTVGVGGVGSFRVIVNGPAGGLGASGVKATATVATGGTLFGSTSAFSS